MKSIIPIFSLVILGYAALPAYGEFNMFGEGYSLYLQTETGILYGSSREIVYQNSGSDDYLSELRWDIKPLVYLGLSLDLAQVRPMDHWGFFAGLGIRAGIPMKTGSMEDRDWHPVSTSPGSLTHFSSHDNFTKAAVLAGLDMGFSLPVWKLLLKFHCGLDYMFFKWEARDGYIQYGGNYYKNPDKNPGDVYEPWNPGFAKKPFSGLGITYVQHWFLIKTGIGVDFFYGPFSFSAAFFAGPVICYSVDNHHERSLRITDMLVNGFFVKPAGSLFFSINDRWHMGLSFSWLYTGEVRGYSRYEEFTALGATNAVYNNIAGVQMQVFDLSLSMRLRY